MTALPRDVFVDTSFWFAALDPNDANHAKAGALVDRARESRSRLHVTREVVSETLTL